MLTVSNLYLLVYALSWTFFLYKNSKNGKFTLSYSMIALYTVLSFVSIFLFNSEEAKFNFESEISLLPLIYLYVSIILCIYPLIKLEESKIKVLLIPSEQRLKFFSWICIILAFYGISDMLPQIQSGFMVMLSDSDAITELYEESTALRKDGVSSAGSSMFFSLLNIMSNQAKNLVPFFLFINLINPKKNKYTTWLLMLSALQMPLSGIAHASRLELIVSFLAIILLFFFFKPYLDSNVKAKIYKVFSVIGGCIAFIFIVITFARVSTGGATSTVYNFASYLGQSTIVFDQYCLDANGTREGNLVAPLLLRAVGKKTLTENEIRDKYSFMRVNNASFSTFVGDMVLDFGPILAFILIVIFSIVCSSYLQNKGTLTFGQLIVIYLVLRFSSGFYQLQYCCMSGNITFVILLMFAFCGKSLSSNQVYRIQK